ncbi:MAG: sugar phosphate nucleotidyltransferase [Candidatus Saccharibacteria bacterium]
MNKKPVTKAVIAAAGFGTRFLPQTKAMPKEMLPLVDKPIIQYIVEELVGAGIEDIVIVTGYHKRAIEDHFDYISTDLRLSLKNSGKIELLEATKRISDLANFAYIRQKGPYGNATPILNAEHLIGDEPFIFAFADDFVDATPTRFKQLVSAYEQHGGMILTCVRANNDADYERYGFVGGTEIEEGLIKMNKIIEKPGKDFAPSDLASVSGYLFTPLIFKYLHQTSSSLETGKEFTMQPSIQKMMDDGHDIFGLEIKNGKFYDTGNKLEYIKTVVDFALKHEDIKDDFSDYLKSLFD